MKRDLLIEFESELEASNCLKVLILKDASLIMRTEPQQDGGRLAFFCVDYQEVDALVGIIKESGGKVKSIVKF